MKLQILSEILSILKRTYNSNENAINVRITSGGGGGNQIFEKGTASVSNALYYDVAFSEPRSNYIPYASINDNLNIWFTDMTANGFRINFSANYTGNIYYCIIIWKLLLKSYLS